MNQPEGYVLVQVKQLAQWREWANNVAAWSKQADRSSEVARLKSSISSAMISATLPPASAAGERERFEAEFPIPDGMVYWDGDKYGVLPDYENSYRADRYCGQWRAWQARAVLATKPQAEQEATPPAQTVQDSEQLPPQYMLAKLQMVMPLFQEARDALTAITEAQRKLHGISSTLADRMDEAGTFSLDDWNASRTRGDEVGKS